MRHYNRSIPREPTHFDILCGKQEKKNVVPVIDVMRI
jgi:hypothetical protein